MVNVSTLENVVKSENLKLTGKSLEGLRAFKVKYDEIMAVFKQEKEAVNKTFVKSSALYAEKYREVISKRDNALRELRSDIITVHRDVMLNVRGMVNDYVTTPMPSDIENTVKFIIEHGDTLSKGELETMCDKCKGNFQAKRALKGYIREQGATLEDVNQILDKLDRDTDKYINHLGNTYGDKLLEYGTVHEVANNVVLEFFESV